MVDDVPHLEEVGGPPSVPNPRELKKRSSKFGRLFSQGQWFGGRFSSKPETVLKRDEVRPETIAESRLGQVDAKKPARWTVLTGLKNAGLQLASHVKAVANPILGIYYRSQLGKHRALLEHELSLPEEQWSPRTQKFVNHFRGLGSGKSRDAFIQLIQGKKAWTQTAFEFSRKVSGEFFQLYQQFSNLQKVASKFPGTAEPSVPLLSQAETLIITRDEIQKMDENELCRPLEMMLPRTRGIFLSIMSPGNEEARIALQEKLVCMWEKIQARADLSEDLETSRILQQIFLNATMCVVHPYPVEEGYVMPPVEEGYVMPPVEEGVGIPLEVVEPSSSLAAGQLEESQSPPKRSKVTGEDIETMLALPQEKMEEAVPIFESIWQPGNEWARNILIDRLSKKLESLDKQAMTPSTGSLLSKSDYFQALSKLYYCLCRVWIMPGQAILPPNRDVLSSIKKFNLLSQEELRDKYRQLMSRFDALCSSSSSARDESIKQVNSQLLNLQQLFMARFEKAIWIPTIEDIDKGIDQYLKAPEKAEVREQQRFSFLVETVRQRGAEGQRLHLMQRLLKERDMIAVLSKKQMLQNVFQSFGIIVEKTDEGPPAL